MDDKVDIITFLSMERNEREDLNEIIDAIRVTHELSGIHIYFRQSWHDCTLEYSDQYFGYKLIFEVEVVDKRKFRSVRLHEYIKGKFGYPVLCSSKMYRYQNGKLSKPIELFTKKIGEVQDVEIF